MARHPKTDYTAAHFRLRFPEADIGKWASRYTDPSEHKAEAVAPPAKARGYLEHREFLAICHWKTPRSRPRCESNSPALVEDVTRLAFSTKNEELKIGVLLILAGVQWPTASVILHFCDRGRYPILDYRALWSLGFPKPPLYTFPFWRAYCEFARELADRTDVSMRVLDRALWQYSKEKQK